MKSFSAPKKLIPFAIWFLVSAFSGIFIFQKFVLDRSPESATPVPRMRSYPWMSLSQWYLFHAEDVALAEQGKSNVLFLGDSLIQNWYQTPAWKKHFEPMAVNFGIGGDMTQNLLWRLQNGVVGNLNPEKIVLQIGTNNLSSSDLETPNEISQGVAAIIDRLETAFPEAQILLMAVFPREDRADHPNRNKVIQLNQHLKSLGESENVTYLDIGQQFLLSDGTLSPELMPDGLHLSELAYEIWAREILQWMRSIEKVSKLSVINNQTKQKKNASLDIFLLKGTDG